MSICIGESGSYSISKDNVIFCEGQKAKSLNILLKGTLDVYLSVTDEYIDQPEDVILNNSYKIFSVNQNIFIGMTDLFLKGKYSFSYKAKDDISIYAFPVNNEEGLKNLLHSQKEYSSYTIISISTMMDSIYSALLKMEKLMLKLNTLTDNLTMIFWNLKDKYNLTYMPSSLFLNDARGKYQELKDLGILPLKLTSEFLDKEISRITDIDYVPIDNVTMEKIEYYKHIINLPAELKKDFFSADDYIAFYHFNDAAQNIINIMNNIKEAIKISEKCFRRIYFEGEACIFSEFINLIKEAKKYGQDCNEFLYVLDEVVKRITDITQIYKDEYNYNLNVDIEYVNNLCNQIKQNSDSDLESNNDKISEQDNIPEELEGSAEKIIRYSGISNEKADLLRVNLNKFRENPEDNSITRVVTPIFFEIYESVFKKVLLENNNSRLFSMFLTYGYMDERLLTTEQVLTLYKLVDKTSNNDPCDVYDSKEWLTQIYNIKKDPSVNEFDQDYFDIFREMKKTGEVTEQDKINYEKDSDARLNFEINNMFKINHRLCYGQSETYFPILHKAMLIGDLSKTLVTKEKVNRIINKILSIDYSAFYRELSYRNPNKNIEKEIIFKAVAPDIILMPIFGFRGIMWQEITGRIRSTPGRFILPILTNENLEDMLIKIIANFRYELCRTMMGVAWNDITIDSLTSEYTDYIQFYRKNKDLSEEAKDKVKIQIQRYNNRIKDIFASDYELWIKHEHKGYIRLNKVARSILYKYCPFSKPIREALEKNPIFNEIAIPFNIFRNKQVKELERRYKKLLDGNISEDAELEANLNFYKEM